jgi:hypothetical protein
VTTSYRLTPPGWNAGRLRVVAIADLHAGGPNMLVERRVVDATNALAPDLVVPLGDYVAHHRFVTEHVPPAVAHEPDIFVKVPSRVCLTLAGHTQGGQIRIPLLWPSFVPSRSARGLPTATSWRAAGTLLCPAVWARSPCHCGLGCRLKSCTSTSAHEVRTAFASTISGGVSFGGTAKLGTLRSSTITPA